MDKFCTLGRVNTEVASFLAMTGLWFVFELLFFWEGKYRAAGSVRIGQVS